MPQPPREKVSFAARRAEFEDHRRVRLLRNVLAICTGIALLHLVVMLLTEHRPLGWHIAVGSTIVGFPILRALVRRSNVDAIGVAFVVFGFSAIATGALTQPALLAPIATAFIVLVLLAGAVAGPRVAVGVAVATAVFVSAMLGATLLGWVDGERSLSTVSILVFEILTAGGVVALLADDRRRAVAALETEEDRLNETSAESPDALLTVAANGIVIACSPAIEPMLGIAPDAVVGTTLDETRALGPVATADTSAGPVEIELVHTRGRTIAVEVNARRARASDGTNLRHVTLRDVSARRLAENEKAALREQLHHAQRLDSLGRLAGGVAHDFNNLLTVILGNASVLRELSPKESVGRELADELKEAGERASQLTRQLLLFSRRDLPNPTVVDLRTVVRNLSPLLSRMLGEHIRIKTALGETPCRIRVDPGQIEQVVMNLAVNARDAMPDGGTITIAVDHRTLAEPEARGWGATLAPGSYVVLSVEDEGGGIAPEVEAHIFEPFFTTKDSGKGTGIGLSVVLAIVEGARGRIRTETRPSGGTTFEVLVPLAPAEEEVAAPGAPIVTEPGRQARILVIEDEAPVRATVRRMLERAHYVTFEAQNGAEAEAALGAGAVDLILSDVILPRQTGPDIIDALEARFGPQRVVFMSGYAADAFEERLRARREVVLLAKPFSSGELLSAVRRALREEAPAIDDRSGSTTLPP